MRNQGRSAGPNEPQLTLRKSVWARCQSRSRSGLLPDETQNACLRLFGAPKPPTLPLEDIQIPSPRFRPRLQSIASPGPMTSPTWRPNARPAPVLITLRSVIVMTATPVVPALRAALRIWLRAQASAHVVSA